MTEKEGIDKLIDLIGEHAIRVERDTVDATDVGFFGIILKPNSDLTARKLKNALERAEQGKHINLGLDDFLQDQGQTYSTLGVWLGDQGLGLALIGLGAQLELWDVVLPTDVGVLDEALVARMIGMGFVKAVVGPDSILR